MAGGFVGTNYLDLNAATVMEALQEYLDKRTRDPLAKVTGFERVSGVGCGDRFRVHLEAVKANEEDDER